MNNNDFLLGNFASHVDTQMNAMRSLVETILDTQVTRKRPSALRACAIEMRKEGEMDMQEQFETQMISLGDVTEEEAYTSQLRRNVVSGFTVHKCDNLWCQGSLHNCKKGVTIKHPMESPFDTQMTSVEWDASEGMSYACHACGSQYCAGPHDCD